MCCVVIEFCGCLPINKVMALDAVLAKLATMRILMACSAISGQAKICLVQISNFDRRTERRADVRGGVALVAGNRGVFPLQRVSGLIVIEALTRGNPVNKVKILTVMLGMAFCALVLLSEFCM